MASEHFSKHSLLPLLHRYLLPVGLMVDRKMCLVIRPWYTVSAPHHSTGEWAHLPDMFFSMLADKDPQDIVRTQLDKYPV